MQKETRPRIVIATPLNEELTSRISTELPECEIVSAPDLQPPARYPGDWPGDPNFTRTAEQQQRYEELLATADALFAVPDESGTLLGKIVEKNDKLRWVHTTAAGGGAQIKRANISPERLETFTATTSAGVHGRTLTEYALFGVLAGAKDLPRIQEDQRNSHWPEPRWTMRALADMTVLVLGLGGIGSRTAAVFSAVGARVWGASRSGRAVDGLDRVIPMDELHGALGEVDALVVTLPGTSATRHLVDTEFLDALKDDAVVVNVGRGSVIDEAALVEVLDRGKISFAALDVTEREPLAPESPLWRHEKVMITPHNAALSNKEPERVVDLFIENAKAWLAGEEMKNVVDKVHFY